MDFATPEQYASGEAEISTKSVASSDQYADGRVCSIKRIIIGATGSVAAIKIPILARLVAELGEERGWAVKVKIVATSSALHFIARDALPKDATLHTDQDEWNMWKRIGDPVLHIQLRDWADIIAIAPLDANTMAKIANGYCDNLLTCILRAWDMRRPRIICPAMNTHMWHHPHTEMQLKALQSQLGFSMVDPISKKLACGDTGIGAMAEPETIARAIIEELEKKRDI